jgi:hypothetical protein
MPSSKVELYARSAGMPVRECPAARSRRSTGSAAGQIVSALASAWPEPRKQLPARQIVVLVGGSLLLRRCHP